jgi:hypothetical protein
MKFDKNELVVETHYQRVDYFSINSLFAFRNVSITIDEKLSIEEKAMSISKECNYKVFRILQREFDDVNTYHIDVLTKLFEITK